MKKLFLILLLSFLLSACSKKYSLAGGYVHENYKYIVHNSSANQNHTELQETAAKIAEKLDLQTDTGVAAYAWKIQEVLANLGFITEGYIPIRAVFYSNGICEIQLTPGGEIYPDFVGDGVFYIDYDYEFIHFYTSNGYIVKVSSDTARVDF